MGQAKKIITLFLFLLGFSFHLTAQDEVFNPDYVLLNGQEVNPTEYSVEIHEVIMVFRRGEARSTLLIESKKIDYTKDGSIETFDCLEFMVKIHKTGDNIHHITAIGPKATLLLIKE
jgi:hypothetical protein